jgi:phosphoglycolate phosphatase
MTTIRSVTVDLDGTLLDTIPDLAAAANAMMRELGRPEFPLETVATFVGRGIPKLVARCLPDLDASGVEAAQDHLPPPLRDRERPLLDAVFPGVLDGLQAMRDAGLRLAVITNKAAAFTEPLLARDQARALVRVRRLGRQPARTRSRIRPLLHACERMGTLPAENLHIGDSHHDAVAARAAGCPVFIVPYGYNEGDGRAGNRLRCYSRVAGRGRTTHTRRE